MLMIRLLGHKLSIQIHISKQGQALNLHMTSNSNFTAPGVPLPAYTQAIPEEPGIAMPTSPNPQTLPSNLDKICAWLHAFRKKENERDAGLDFVDLCQLMRAALQTSNDVQMIEVLQVGREEMPEAIKTLRRALEREREKENVVLREQATHLTPNVLQQHACWERDPFSRPSFKHIALELKQLRSKAGSNIEGHNSPRPLLYLWEPMYTQPSLDMRSIPLPGASVSTRHKCLSLTC